MSQLSACAAGRGVDAPAVIVDVLPLDAAVDAHPLSKDAPDVRAPTASS
ncbi:MAG TPA: hypothetical protein VE869_06485 [Gemmatimonas sp.]|nr:hypothetical protein [Gemmatimonas sp.]